MGVLVVERYEYSPQHRELVCDICGLRGFSTALLPGIEDSMVMTVTAAAEIIANALSLGWRFISVSGATKVVDTRIACAMCIKNSKMPFNILPVNYQAIKNN